MPNSGAGPLAGSGQSADAARAALRGLIAKAIRDYPAHVGRPEWSYGLDHLALEDFVPGLTDHIMTAITGSPR